MSTLPSVIRHWARTARRALAAALLGMVAPSASAAPALYVFDDPSSGGVIWLFPVVHALPAGLDWRTPDIAKAFDAADIVVLETDPQASAQAERPLPPPTRSVRPWTELWPDDLKTRFRIRAQAERLDADRLARTRPVFAALALSPRSPWPSRAGWGIEAVLADAARTAQKPVLDLEPADAFRRRALGLSDAEARDWLALILNEPVGFAERLAAAWTSGDVETVERFVVETPRDRAPGAFSALVTQRHASWIATLKAQQDQGRRLFVAIGAAHVYGPDGLRAALQAPIRAEP
ncbi:MAG: TraB/GumN family protein [Maricaulaceae bacterium]